MFNNDLDDVVKRSTKGEMSMQKVEDVIKEQYGDVNQCSKLTRINPTQLRRWIAYDCLVDSKGRVWKWQGSFNATGLSK